MRSLRLAAGLMALALLSLAFFKPPAASATPLDVVAPDALILKAEGWHHSPGVDGGTILRVADAVATPDAALKAKLMAAASGMGALVHCKQQKDYKTTTPEVVYPRLVAIFRAEGADPEFSRFTFQVFQQSRQFGVAVTLDPRSPVALDESGGPKFLDRDMDTAGSCEAVEAMLLNMMEKGGVLDVAPMGGKDS